MTSNPPTCSWCHREDGEHAYLTDFGIAKATASETAGLTEAGQLLGTVDYLAPETIQNGQATPAADIYALACLLYELLAGITPFARDTDVATIWAHVQEPPPPLPHTNLALAALDPSSNTASPRNPATASNTPASSQPPPPQRSRASPPRRRLRPRWSIRGRRACLDPPPPWSAAAQSSPTSPP